MIAQIRTAFRDLPIARKIIATLMMVALVAIPTAVVGVLAVADLSHSRDLALEAARAERPRLAELADIRQSVGDSVRSVQMMFVVVWLANLIVSLFAVRMITTMVIHRVRGVTAVARRVTAGDLTASLDRDTADETGELQEAFGQMVGSIRDVVGQIDIAAVDLKTASAEMASTSDEAGRAVGEVARAISSISEGAAHQVDLVTTTRQIVAEIERSVGETADNARAAQAESENTMTLAEDGVARAVEVQQAMDAVRESAESSASVVRDLGQKSEHIDQIVQTITSIASQTNLLALNAAIEAARAGEQGRGFAVVADEVRKLAENSESAASDVSELIAEIQAETERAISAMEDGVDRVESGAHIVDSNRDTFSEIQQAVQRLHGRSVEIATSAEQLSDGTDRVRQQIEQVASVAEQSSASTEEVSASTEQTSASAQQVTANAQGVAQTATGLAELARRFRVRT